MATKYNKIGLFARLTDGGPPVVKSDILVDLLQRNPATSSVLYM